MQLGDYGPSATITVYARSGAGLVDFTTVSGVTMVFTDPTGNRRPLSAAISSDKKSVSYIPQQGDFPASGPYKWDLVLQWADGSSTTTPLDDFFVGPVA